MKRVFLLAFLLAACREDTSLPAPVEMTAQTVGYFCQMNVLEHGGPKGQIALDGLPGKPLFFSQVTETVDYLRMPEQNFKVLATYVNDMGAAVSWADLGTGNWILIDKAVFVVGSDQMGGMDQPEFFPFADAAKAARFAAEHGGTVTSLPNLLAATPDPSADTSDTTDYGTRLRALTQQPGG